MIEAAARLLYHAMAFVGFATLVAGAYLIAWCWWQERRAYRQSTQPFVPPVDPPPDHPMERCTPYIPTRGPWAVPGGDAPTEPQMRCSTCGAAPIDATVHDGGGVHERSSRWTECEGSPGTYHRAARPAKR